VVPERFSSPLWRRRETPRAKRVEEKAWERRVASRKPERVRAAPRQRRERSKREEGEGVEASTSRREPTRAKRGTRTRRGSTGDLPLPG